MSHNNWQDTIWSYTQIIKVNLVSCYTILTIPDVKISLDTAASRRPTTGKVSVRGGKGVRNDQSLIRGLKKSKPWCASANMPRLISKTLQHTIQHECSENSLYEWITLALLIKAYIKNCFLSITNGEHPGETTFCRSAQ